jgi:ComF family protein
MLQTAYRSLLSVIYPQACQICGSNVESTADGVACRECWASARILNDPVALCEKCGGYLGGQSGTGAVRCGQCSDHFYDRAFAAGVYEGALAATVVTLKREPHLCRRGRELLIAAFEGCLSGQEPLLIPIPLSRKRQIERGFNQAEVLASILGKAFRIKVTTDLLTRTSHTPMHRAAMDRKAREATVKNAFELKNGAMINNANVVLVDDVFTSGATASSCARLLKRSGASRVDVMTLARASRSL